MSDGGHFKNVQSPYLHNRSTDFDEIWHDDACWPFEPNVNLKFLIVDNPAASKFSGIAEWRVTLFGQWDGKDKILRTALYP